ncbi:uncharacterized protein [Argopecten irradians]|uniref:uncharacterized protein n=1 Tax=Argopecten irradians TaxID=31199 RepID=UPI003717FA5D
MATATIPIRMKGETTCLHHKGRKLELYCEQCNELVCLKCVSANHKGHIFCELSEITSQKKLEIRNFIDSTEENELVQIRNSIDSAVSLLEDNDKIFDRISDQLMTQTEKLKQDLDMLTADTLTLYQNTKEDNTKLIQQYKHELELYEHQLTQMMQECKSTLQQGIHIDIYDTECELNFGIRIPVKPVLAALSFTPNETPLTHLELALGACESDDSGQDHTLAAEVQADPSPDEQGASFTQQRTENKEENEDIRETPLTEARVLNWWGTPYGIRAISPTTRDQAWTRCENILTLMDGKGKMMQEVIHTANIIDISLSPTTNRLWACDTRNNILELKSGKLTQQFQTKKKAECICVAAYNDILIGMSKHICRYTVTGHMILITKTTDKRKPLVCSPCRIAECPITNNIAVIDHSYKHDGGDGKRHVVILDSHFRELVVYRGDSPTANVGGEFYPNDIVYDTQGNIIIADRNSGETLLLSGNGVPLRTLNTGGVTAVGVGRPGILWTVIDSYNVELLQYNVEK